jgi:hypothetical protein
MAVVNKILGVKATNTTAYQPRTNGQVDRFNSTLCTAITHYATTQNSWDLSWRPQFMPTIGRRMKPLVTHPSNWY